MAQRTWTTGETVTAALLNQEVRDPVDLINAAWTAWTPTWTGTTTNPTYGNATVSSRYKQVGKLVMFTINVTLGSTSNVGAGLWAFSLPVTGVAAPVSVGHTHIRDVSAPGDWHGSAAIGATTVAPFAYGGAASGAEAQLSPTFPFAWAVSDVIRISGVYEAA